MVWLFTDGACSGNPGPGAWAWIRESDNQHAEGSGYEFSTTNNRMELSAALHGLKALETSESVTIVSDSAYVVNGMKSWVRTWQSNGWVNSQRKPVENQDLWKALIQESGRFSELYWQWVKGHGTHLGNIKADALARETLKSSLASKDAVCASVTPETVLVSEIWIGDAHRERGLFASLPCSGRVEVLQFRDKQNVPFTSTVWQKSCLQALRDVPGVLFLEVRPKAEESDAYEAYGFFLASALNAVWRLILIWMISFSSGHAENIKKPEPKQHAYLKAKRVYWRSGPGSEHSVVWIYTCPGWPVFIRKRWGYWCQIEDVKGGVGWVHGNLLAFRRVVFVKYAKTPLYAQSCATSKVKAYLEPGVLGLCIKQEKDWLYVRLLKERYEGWIHRSHIWQPSGEKK